MSFLQDVFIGRIVWPCSCNWQNQEGGRFCCFSTGWAFCQPLCSQERLVCPLLVQNNILAACFECQQPRAVFLFSSNFNFAKLARILLKMKLFTANQNTFPGFSESVFQSIHVYAFKVCSRNVHG